MLRNVRLFIDFKINECRRHRIKECAGKMSRTITMQDLTHEDIPLISEWIKSRGCEISFLSTGLQCISCKIITRNNIL